MEPNRKIVSLLDRPPVKVIAREFSNADRALIRRVHGFMPAQTLLGILNERLVCDLGDGAVLYTIDQLYAEIGTATPATPQGGHDWASLRKVLAKARRAGVLSLITVQVIDDFAVVFSLNPRQVVRLKDIILRAEEQS